MANILYIEDSPANQLLVRQVLERAGHVIIEAHDGPSGLRLARETKPDLILMDINIPGLDGYETATRLKSLPQLDQVPVIALTANTMIGDRERALIAGCDGYLVKPVNVAKFPGQIAEFLSGRREKVSDEQESVYLREFNRRLVERLEQKVADLTAANEALARADVMKSRFINMAAHELRTPLTAMRGYLDILTAPSSQFLTQADAQARELLEGVVTGVDRLAGMVQDMLDITRIEAGILQLKPTLVSLSLVFKKIEKEFAGAVAERKQTLRVHDAAAIPPFWADGERVIQILRNLVGNAIKYTPDGGAVELSARLIEPDVETATTTQLLITVADTGIGIAADQQADIFKNFYEVRELEHHSSSKTRFLGSGAGLGLPIARGVAEAHGGRLWVESPGHDPEACPGSTFHLILPLKTSPKD